MAPTHAHDVAIIGGGAAGCVLARRLAERGDRSVVLIEAGPDRTGDIPADWRDGWRLPTVPDWGFATEPDAAGATTRLRRGKLLGGTAWLTRFAVRGAAADQDAWAARGNAGWRYEDVLPAFRRLEADAEFGESPWHGGRGPIPITRYPGLEVAGIHATALSALEAMGFPAVADHNDPAANGVGRMPMSARDGVRVTSADAYLPADDRPADLTVLPEAPVATVLLEGTHATGVRLVDGSQVNASTVVLAAGTYGSPVILMRSGVGPAAHLRDHGIAVRVDLPGVGSNLADHPGVSIDSGLAEPGSTGQVLHSIATFRSDRAAVDGAPDLMLWLSDPTDGDPAFWVEVVLLKPESRGSVRLRSADPTALPHITLPSVTTTADLDRLVEGYRRGLDLVERLKGRLQRTPPSREARRRLVEREAYSIPHVVGTCAMGPAPDDGGVVDHLGRVHGTEGLWVIDASIIPDAPSGFPHLVTMMLAEHLSERAFGAR